MDQNERSALDKAKAAVADAQALDVALAAEAVPKTYLRLLDIAQVQANIAQAEALEEIGRNLRRFSGRSLGRSI